MIHYFNDTRAVALATARSDQISDFFFALRRSRGGISQIFSGCSADSCSGYSDCSAGFCSDYSDCSGSDCSGCSADSYSDCSADSDCSTFQSPFSADKKFQQP